MLVCAQQGHTAYRRSFFGELRYQAARPFIDFRDNDEPAAWLYDPQDFADVGWQVRPPEMGFDGRHQVECVIGKRQSRDRRFPYLDAAYFDPFAVDLRRYGDALAG